MILIMSKSTATMKISEMDLIQLVREIGRLKSILHSTYGSTGDYSRITNIDEFHKAEKRYHECRERYKRITSK